MNKSIAEFAAKLNYQDLPEPVVTIIKHSFIDAIACALFGSTKVWSEMARDVVASENQNGTCIFPSFPKSGLPPSSAALLLGSYCHAFELDNLRFPGAGVHPGAVIMCPLVALAREYGLSGRKLIASAVVGVEALSRLGLATKHSLENRGFHAPGVIGPVGGAIACAAALGANSKQIMNASGIAASMSAGLLAFAKSDGGGMIKRLHLGRSAEAAVRAAQLAMRGFEGPDTAVDGHFGLLEAFCPEFNKIALTEELGSRWESLSICFKTFPAHITAHAPLMATLELLQTCKLSISEIARITIYASKKVVSHHNIKQPHDIMQAQYSVPFCLAAGLVVDLSDPENFTSDLLQNPVLQAILQRIEVFEHDGPAEHSWHARVKITMQDGQVIENDAAQFRGLPNMPMSDNDISRKFQLLTKRVTVPNHLLSDLMKMEDLQTLPGMV